MCIGSHYAVRTVALRESGGLGAELPKGRNNKNAISLSMLLPYILIVAASSVFSVFHANSPYTTGYFYLTLFNILTYVVLVATILACQTCENRRAI
jgi:hypothetical protein